MRGFKADHLIFGRKKGGSLKTLQGFRAGTTQIWLENEAMWGGSRKSSKFIKEDHFSEVTFKGGVG